MSEKLDQRVSRVRHFWVNFLLLTGSLLVGALVFEGVIRAVNRWERQREQERFVYRGGVVEDSVLGYRLKPSGSGHRMSRGEFDLIERTNSMGLRADHEYGAKPDGTFRLLAIGDSFTFGVGVKVHDTYEHQLEQMLNARFTGQQYEVINAGVPGYSTVQELQWLERISPELEPDLVLVGLYLGDDLTQNAQHIPVAVQKREAQNQRFYNPAAYRGRLPIPFKAVLAERSEA